MTEERARLSRFGLLLLALLALGWGLNWPIMKIVLQDVPPLTFRGSCLLLGAAPVGVLCMLGAAMSWGLGVVLLKRYALKMPTTMLTGWSMLLGAAPICVAALLLESGQWRAVGFWPAFGLAYNVVVAFMFCYWAWNRIVLMVPVAVSSLSSLVTPVIGVIGGMWLLGEQPGWNELAGAVLILGALATVLLPQRK